jgi:cell division protein FtsW (lipid II flippase)
MARPRLSQLDWPLLSVVIVICLLGLYNLSSASRPMGVSLHVSQGLHMAVGFLLLSLVVAVHYRNLEGLAYPIFVVCVLALVATDLFGKLVNGSRRWLVLGPVNVQTSDLAKIAVILAVAKTFHLERWDGPGLTLGQIFRPLNLSRPVLLVVGVIALSAFGEAIKPAKLEVMVNKRHRAVATLTQGHPKVIVGRDKEAGVRLEHSGVADRHAEVEWLEAGRIVLRDLGAPGGTFVDGERVAGEVELRHGQEVRFGLNPRAELRFSASMQRIRPALPWLAIAGALWLAAALVVQLRRGAWVTSELLAPIDVVLAPAALILLQPDLGTAIIVVLIAFSMILYVGLRPSALLTLVSGGLAFVVVAWFALLKPYQKERVTTFLDPDSDLAGAGYHQNQSMIAIGSGELWGKGHGQGTQTQLSFLPEQQTDFIFSVWSEEQGFLGCLLMVVLFAALVLLSLRVAARARDRFGALLAIGATSMIFWHASINMLMVLRLAPVVGVPLPLWSNGGSFVVTVLIGVGLLLNVSFRRNLF